MSHRLHLARSAVAHGYRVAVLCRATGYRDRIEDAGFEVFDWRLSRGSLNPRQELRALLGVLRALRQFRPELVHVVALKPSIYVALANSLERVGSIVYALGGLGFVFTSRRVLARSLRPILLLLFRWMFRRKSDRLILQNPDDQALLLAARVIDPKQVRLIRGAGVDTRVFSPRPKEDSGVPLVVLPARLLWDKGVGEFVEAARSLRQRGVSARFILVGEPDPHNPECVPEDQVESWVNEGVVEAWGNREDMPDVLNRASIICLPSYREGLPKALLEAASCAKPIVTFDVPGCREVVVEGLNGFLVPPRDVLGLIGALQSLCQTRSCVNVWV